MITELDYELGGHFKGRFDAKNSSMTPTDVSACGFFSKRRDSKLKDCTIMVMDLMVLS